MIMKTTMKMKSTLKAAALLLMATVMTTGMTSCSSDDDNSTKTDNTVTGTIASFTVELPQTTASILDATVEYTDGAGVKHTEAITGQTIDITSTTPNSEGDLIVRCTLKKDAKYTESAYLIGAMVYSQIKAVNAKGQVIATSKGLEGLAVGSSKTPDKIEEFMAKNPQMKMHYIISTNDTEVKLSTRKTVESDTNAKAKTKTVI